MEGPYRDLGSGFARLVGLEGARRAPSRIHTVEDAVFELLRNSHDAGAHNIYVSSTLRSRRYRSLTILDDGHGIPETHAHLIFEPGITTRHLLPKRLESGKNPHGAGLSLYHIKKIALSAVICSAASPTALSFVFDTEKIPEKSLQSATRTPKSNILATISSFALQSGTLPKIYYSTPARIVATLLYNRIILTTPGKKEINTTHQTAKNLGLQISKRTTRRILKREIDPVEHINQTNNKEETSKKEANNGTKNSRQTRKTWTETTLQLEDEDLKEIEDILRRVARASYLDIWKVDQSSRPGEISFKAHLYAPEEEYD